MCRHFSYLGPPIPLADLVSRPAHSLTAQSHIPKDMRGSGQVNADGFGVGWYPVGPSGGRAMRYRRSVPIWQDLSFNELAEQIVSPAILGAVRNATPGMSVCEGACAPFTDGRWLFSLNGGISGWPDTAARLAGTLAVRDLLTLDAPTDSALLWSILRHRLVRTQPTADPIATSDGGPAARFPDAPDDPGDVLAGLVAEVLAAAPSSRLNLLLTDGRTTYATTVTHALWYRQTQGSVTVASEPFDDDPLWRPLSDGQLVVADLAGVRITPLPVPPMPTDRKSEAHVNQRR